MEYYNIGDEKTITLSTGENVTLVILGFNHDDLTSGGKVGISIGMENLLTTTYPMNLTNTDEGGWDSSIMKTSTMQTLLSQLPSDLQNVIKNINKKIYIKPGSLDVNISTNNKLWLLSIDEIKGGGHFGAVIREGEQYDYWKTIKNGKNEEDRIKYLSNGSGLAADWWLRSSSNDNTNFECISNYGYNGGSPANESLGISFGFCV